MRLEIHLARLVAILSFSFALSAADVQRIATTLNGHEVELALLRLEDRELVSWPDTTVQLVAELSIAGPELNLAARLAKNGIEPDVGAYALFYELNPQVTKASSVPQDAKLLLPKVAMVQGVAPLLANGSHLVVVLMNSQLRSELNEASAKLQELSDQFRQLSVARFGSAEEHSAVLKQVHDLAGWYGHISATGQQRKGPPMNRETLIGLRDEARALSSILQSHLAKRDTLDITDRDQIGAIHSDVEREIRRYDEVQSGTAPDPDSTYCCQIVVTIDGDKNQLDRIRIWYTLYGLYRPPPGPVPGSAPFTAPFENGAPSKYKSPPLRAKNYMVWAVAEGQEDRIVTKPMKAQVGLTADKTTTVQLILLSPSQETGNGRRKADK